MLDTKVELIAHLLRRAGFGANREELATLLPPGVTKPPSRNC